MESTPDMTKDEKTANDSEQRPDDSPAEPEAAPDADTPPPEPSEEVRASYPALIRGWRKEIFMSYYGLREEDLKRANLNCGDLAAIDKHYADRQRTLSNTEELIARTLRQCPGVHFVRSRVKSSASLIQKVLRKRIEDRRPIDFSNYEDEITDRIGIRAIHLYKHEWRTIHSFIRSNWDLREERPTAYIRKGDSDSLVEQFETEGCNVEPHPRGYRSIHYLITTQPNREPLSVEIQVRTLFEEGWSEVDHQLVYPNVFESDDVMIHSLDMLNRFASGADEMATFIDRLDKHLIESKRREAAAAEKLEKVIAESKLTRQEKTELESQLKASLEARTAVYAPAASAKLKDYPPPDARATAEGAYDKSKGRFAYRNALLRGVIPEPSLEVVQRCSRCNQVIDETTQLYADGFCSSCRGSVEL